MPGKANSKKGNDKRINFVLSQDEYKILKNIQYLTDLNISDIIRSAIRIYDWTQDGKRNRSKNELIETVKNAIRIYVWAEKQAKEDNVDLSTLEFIRNSIKLFLWARNKNKQGGNLQLESKEIEILF